MLVTVYQFNNSSAMYSLYPNSPSAAPEASRILARQQPAQFKTTELRGIIPRSDRGGRGKEIAKGLPCAGRGMLAGGVY